MRTIAFHNLGCKVNSYETDYMEQKSIENGYEIVKFEQKADVYVVNTCSVTNIADRKSRQMLHKAKKMNPDAIVVAMGCYVQANPEEAAKDECIDIIVGNNKKSELFEIIDEYNKKKNKKENDSKNCLSIKDLDGRTLTDINHCEFENMNVEKSAERCRVFVKIQDGCDRYCSYCIIPYVRGNIRSRKSDDVIKEIETIASNGYKEVVVTGIHLSSYGKDFNDGKDSAYHLGALLKRINDIDGIERIRIGSFEPMILSEEFVKELSSIKKLCPHFHISLQSGCDTVLKRMNRHYDSEKFYEKTVLLRRYFDNPALTTDVIAGFPGESEEEFNETYEYLKKIKFFETHIFPYSRRKGTVADRLPGQLTMKEKKERVDKLVKLDDSLSLEYRRSKIGKKDKIIVEEVKVINGVEYLVGHTAEYVMCAIKYTKDSIDLTGQYIDVEIEKMLDEKTVLAKIL